MVSFHYALKRLSECKTVDEVSKFEASITRVYNAGCLTEKELFRLYDKAFQKIASIEVND